MISVQVKTSVFGVQLRSVAVDSTNRAPDSLVPGALPGGETCAGQAGPDTDGTCCAALQHQVRKLHRHDPVCKKPASLWVFIHVCVWGGAARVLPRGESVLVKQGQALT